MLCLDKKFKSRINRPEKEISEEFVLKQIKGYKEIVTQDENNVKAAKKLKKLEKQLVEVRANKLKKGKNKLKSMVEFLAMDEKDVLQLMAIFKEMDEDDSGEVSLTEFFDYIDVDRSVFGDKMFQFLDENNDGQLDFLNLSMLLVHIICLVSRNGFSLHLACLTKMEMVTSWNLS